MSAFTRRHWPRKSPATSPQVKADDNTKVHAGDVVATIDDGDYRIAVDAARANIATQAATIERIGEQVTPSSRPR